MKKLLLLLFIGSSFQLLAQDPEDALRYSWFTAQGTSRSNALGGAMGSLGGDLSSAHINPAGLGFYKNSEFLFSGKLNNRSNSIDYFNTNTTTTSNKFSLGNLGVVFADGRKKNNWTSTAFSISFIDT